MTNDRELARQALLRIGDMCGADYDDDAPLDFLARQAPEAVAELAESLDRYRRSHEVLSGQASGRSGRTIRRWLKS